MNKRTRGSLSSHINHAHARIGIAVSRFHPHITRRLLKGALTCLDRYEIGERSRKIVECPGSFELPQTAQLMVSSGKFDAVICLGAIVRGETPHFDLVARETARGIQDVALRHGVPVILGVLTTNTERQALDRSGGRHGNKGWDAALAALEMAANVRSLPGRHRRGR